MAILLNTLFPPPSSFVVQFLNIIIVFAFHRPQWIFFPSQSSLISTRKANSSWKPITPNVFLCRLLLFLLDGPSFLSTDTRCQFYPSFRSHRDLSSWPHTHTCIWMLALSCYILKTLACWLHENHQGLRATLNQYIFAVSLCLAKLTRELSEFMLCRTMLANTSSLEPPTQIPIIAQIN